MLLDVRILQIVFDDPVRMSMWHDLSGILNFSVQSTLPYAPNFMIIVFICVLCSMFFNLFFISLHHRVFKGTCDYSIPFPYK